LYLYSAEGAPVVPRPLYSESSVQPAHSPDLAEVKTKENKELFIKTKAKPIDVFASGQAQQT